VINLLEAVLKKEKNKLYKDSLHPMTVDELNLRIAEAENDISEGRVYTTDEIRIYLNLSL
jgi:uncharacterized small protein (DUF1192 family)